MKLKCIKEFELNSNEGRMKIKKGSTWDIEVENDIYYFVVSKDNVEGKYSHMLLFKSDIYMQVDSYFEEMEG